jgi:hypothetical protein
MIERQGDFVAFRVVGAWWRPFTSGMEDSPNTQNIVVSSFFEQEPLEAENLG